MGLAPAATLRRPSPTNAWASTVAVVVPITATSAVLLATSFTIWAPMFSTGFSSSISFATDTPSLVTEGAPNFLSMTTLRPWTQGHLHRICQRIHACLQVGPGVAVKLNVFCHDLECSGLGVQRMAKMSASRMIM